MPPFARKSLEEPVGDLEGRTRRRVSKALTKQFEAPRERPRFPKGNKFGGKPADVQSVYREVRRLCVNASPDVARELIRLAHEAEDERVRSVCAIAVLDRAGIRPIDAPDPGLDREQRRRFDPAAYSMAELEVIEAALKLLVRGRGEGEQVPGLAPPPEIIPPD